MSQCYLFATVCFHLHPNPVRNPCVSVYFVETTPLKFHPIYFCVVVVVVFCRSQRQSRRKVGSLCFFLSSRHMLHRGHTFQQRARWPRIVDDVGPWELKFTKSKMARGRQCRRHGWFFSRFSSFLQGQQRLQVDKTVRTVLIP